jgi:hypothetical protein
MVLLPPDGAVDLPAVRIRSIGVRADVSSRPRVGAGRDRAGLDDLAEDLENSGVPAGGARALAAAAAGQQMRPVLAVPLEDLATIDAGNGLRALDASPAVELEVEAPSDDEAQVLLEIDGTGVVSWHFPQPSQDRTGADRADAVQTFRIPIRQADVPGQSAPRDEIPTADRGVFGIGTRKLLHLIRYPVEKAVGRVGTVLVGAWEGRARPYGLRLVRDQGLTGEAPGVALTSDDWAELHDAPTLLLVHGTFSTALSAFGGLADDPALLVGLIERYHGRVLLFDHPSLHVDPVANARWFLEQVPPDVDLRLDVVSHSRGGLVSRALSTSAVLGISHRQPTLRNVVHVATPNAGTVLADPERWGTLFDTITNLSMLFPDDLVSVPLTGVVEVVKQVGTGVLDGLGGLASMQPGCDLLSSLTAAAAAEGTTTRQFAVSSDFEPEQAPLPLRALDLLVDSFFGEGNDLIVPTEGVSQVPGLRIDDVLRLPQRPAISHVNYFRDRTVRTQLAAWLPGDG